MVERVEDGFYLPEPHPQVSQGDLYLIPTTFVRSHDSRQDVLPHVSPAPPRVGGVAASHAWDPAVAGERGVPAAVIETRWGVALVLSHNCEIDKEFNEEVDRLVGKEGFDEERAKLQASRDWDLDRHVTLGPLLSYEEIGASKHAGIRSGQRIGYFPLPPIPGFGAAGFAVHLSRAAAVERRLLRAGFKVGSLASDSVKRLQYKIAEVFASRRLALLSEIEAAVGREITGVSALKASRKKMTVALKLDDGSELQVDTKPGRSDDIPERLRVPEE